MSDANILWERREARINSIRGCRRSHMSGWRDCHVHGIIPAMLAHSADLRRGRHSEPCRIYLVTTVVHARRPVFTDFALARLAIGELRRCDEMGRCRTLAFVLMPDHLHWLMRLDSGELSRVVGDFKANAAKAVNRRRGTSGLALWQHGFHDHALRREDDLPATARYLVANPLRAGLVKRVGDYPHWDAVWL